MTFKVIINFPIFIKICMACNYETFNNMKIGQSQYEKGLK